MTSPPNDPNDPRATQRLAWARAALREPGLLLERASTDAGFRSYWRSVGVEPTRIVMDSPPDKEDVRPWLRLRDLLESGGVRVPKVLARDVGAGFLLLEDLGRDTFLQVIDAGNADALFDAALAQLLKIQRIVPPADLPAYDAALLLRELRLFDEWFCEQHLGLALTDAERSTLAAAYRFLIDAALAQPQVLVHRDFMPRNLMPAADGPAVLDFQDAVRGPIAYDPLSLFKDAFLSWPEARVSDWLDRYHDRARAAGLPVPDRRRFRHDAEMIGAQRHLKVIGIFARLNHRDGKPKYLADAPRFFDYLAPVLPRHPQLDGLHRFIEARVLPAIAATATADR
ncbi:phosphotransferase [Thermomonas sp.]|uniref:aminoglycoside phosphotransferase family protein n=1 Tax=Thermomonas sp. TaxID=1971895 RepID=UPI00262A7B28|nr:phosphotransferase [Thermomonas sp.]